MIDTIWIGPIKYKVIYVDETKDDSDSDCFGLMDKINQEIRLSTKLKGSFAAAVLMHEIFHGIFEICGLEDREGVMDQLSYSFLDLFRQNPTLIAYIQETFNEMA